MGVKTMLKVECDRCEGSLTFPAPFLGSTLPFLGSTLPKLRELVLVMEGKGWAKVGPEWFCPACKDAAEYDPQ